MNYEYDSPKICLSLRNSFNSEIKSAFANSNNVNTSETTPNSNSNNKKTKCFDFPYQISNTKKVFQLNMEEIINVKGDCDEKYDLPFKEETLYKIKEKKKNKSVLNFNIITEEKSKNKEDESIKVQKYKCDDRNSETCKKKTMRIKNKKGCYLDLLNSPYNFNKEKFKREKTVVYNDFPLIHSDNNNNNNNDNNCNERALDFENTKHLSNNNSNSNYEGKKKYDSYNLYSSEDNEYNSLCQNENCTEIQNSNDNNDEENKIISNNKEEIIITDDNNEEKNYIINSIIEEEKSDMVTESELSNKKLSLLLSKKQKIEKSIEYSEQTEKKEGDKCAQKDLQIIYEKMNKKQQEQFKRKENIIQLNKKAIIEKFMTNQQSIENNSIVSFDISIRDNEHKTLLPQKCIKIKKAMHIKLNEKPNLEIKREICINIVSPINEKQKTIKSLSNRFSSSRRSQIPFTKNRKPSKTKITDDYTNKFLSPVSRNLMFQSRSKSKKEVKRARSYSKDEKVLMKLSLLIKENKEILNINNENINYSNTLLHFQEYSQNLGINNFLGNKSKIMILLKSLKYYRKNEKLEVIKILKTQSNQNFFALYIIEENLSYYFLGLYIINKEKEMLFKLTSRNKYSIPIKIKFSNIINHYISDDKFCFYKKSKLILEDQIILFFPNNLKF